ncbi:Lipoyl synthase [subsurface metagenome]
MRKRKHPDWLKVKIPSGKEYHRIKSLLASSRLHTICEEAKCPNIAECFGKGTATFLILGDVCTRNCTYCNVKKGTPRKIDSAEPERVARIVKKLNLHYVVITSVTRDDLPDGGADIFVQTNQKIKELSPKTKIEALIPDFKGNLDSLKKTIDAKPYVLGHNLETVERLFPTVRSQGNYRRSLNLLKEAKEIDPDIFTPLEMEVSADKGNENTSEKRFLSLTGFTKSGIMVGMGETKEEIIEVMKDLRGVGCDIFTIGQYLQPSLNHLPITPEEFKEFQKIGEELGFLHVESGPLVRSSYCAGEYVSNHLTPTRW